MMYWLASTTLYTLIGRVKKKLKNRHGFAKSSQF